MDRRLALFDLDGTITTRDTMLGYVWHARGPLRTVAGVAWLAPVLALQVLGLVSSERAKIAWLRHFFGGISRTELEGWARSFVPWIEANTREEARQRLDWHRNQGHDVVIVSASLDLWLLPWAERYGVRLLCTEGRFQGDTFTGDLATPNCKGPEKEARIRGALDLSTYAYVYAYGDSSGDVEMLALADESWFRPFRG